MRIRTKLGFVELILVIGFLIAMGVVIFYTNSIIRLKDFQVQSNVVMSSLRRMNYQTQSLLTTRAPVIEISVHWTNTINEFERDLEALSGYSNLMVLSTTQKEQMAELTGWWEQIYQWYYKPAIDHLQKMQVSESGDAVGSQGILRTLLELQSTEGEPPDFLGQLHTIRNYRDLIMDETQTFSNRLLELTSSIEQQVDSNIQQSYRIVIALIVLTVVLTIFITTRFAHLMGSRIRKVEQAMRHLARGDFSTRLDIQSKDEFQELSENYNILKTQLQEKLNSVLGFMVDISNSLAEGPQLQRIMNIITSSAVENTDADGAALYLVDSEQKMLVPQTFSGDFIPPFPVPEEAAKSQKNALEYARETQLTIGENAIGTAVENVKPLFIRSASELSNGTLGVHREKDDPLYIESMIISPLMISQRVLGTIVMTKKAGGGNFTDLDFTHMQTFADYAALTIDNIFNYEELIEKREMHREIEIAANIQKGLLPREIPELTSTQMAAFSRAARGISGDYYDAFLIEKGILGVVVCDVVGKGVPASLLMVMIRTVIRLISSPQRTPAQLLTLLNRGIIGRIGTEHFATLCMFSYNEEKKEITYSNAAHPPLLLYRSSEDEFLEIDTPGLPIGIEQKEQYQQRKFTVQSGDIVILFTDGIPETRSPDGREYSTETMKSSLKQVKGKTAKAISKHIQKDLDRFTESAEQHDDQTLFVMKIK